MVQHDVTDPTRPGQLSLAVERVLRNVLGWRNRPAPIDVYMAIRVRDALAEDQATSETSTS